MNARLTTRFRAIVPLLSQTRGMRIWELPPDFKDVIMPPAENRLLPILDKVPVIPITAKPFKYERRFRDLRGPELIHNTLMYKQYGIIALTGGNLKDEHIQQMRETVNNFINVEKMFAIWRIDPPWKSICKRGQGKRMGGGKASISYYVTPVRAGRVLLEVGGYMEFEEVLPMLQTVTRRLPCTAMPIDCPSLETLRQQYREAQAKNMNPVTYRRVVEKNLVNVLDSRMSNEYDQLWFGKYD